MTPTARAVATILGVNPEDKGKDLHNGCILSALTEARIELGAFVQCGAGPRTQRALAMVLHAIEVLDEGRDE